MVLYKQNSETNTLKWSASQVILKKTYGYECFRKFKKNSFNDKLITFYYEELTFKYFLKLIFKFK